ITGLNQILQEGARGLGHPRLVLWSELAGISVALPMLVLLLRVWPVMGPAVASLIGACIGVTVLLTPICHLVRLGPARFLLPGRADVQDVVGRLCRAVRRGRSS